MIYIDSVFKLIASPDRKSTLPEEPDGKCVELCTRYNSFKGELLKPDDSIELCINFIRKCQNNESGSYKLRGPHLALFLLYKKLDEQGHDPMKYLGK